MTSEILKNLAEDDSYWFLVSLVEQRWLPTLLASHSNPDGNALDERMTSLGSGAPAHKYQRGTIGHHNSSYQLKDSAETLTRPAGHFAQIHFKL